MHLLQAMQPLIGSIPSQNISVSIPSFFNSFSISSNAKFVHPSLCGLPFTNITFINTSIYIIFISDCHYTYLLALLMVLDLV